MNLQEMLGDAFHEGMTIDEINTALSGKKFADLSTGQYVDKNKYDADLKAKDNIIADKDNTLNTYKKNASDSANDKDAQAARIQELEDYIKNQTISTNRDKAEALTSDIKSILGIKSDDADYTGTLDILSNVETENSRTLATYINKVVKDAYEKGKTDAIKDNLGNFGKDVSNQGSAGSKTDVGAFGKQLAESLNKSKVDSNLYFAKK